MPINQKNKIIIASLAFLIVGVLMYWNTLFILIHWKQNEKMSMWDFITARPVPSAVNQYPTPAPIDEEFIRKTQPIPVSMEAWLERLNSKKIPETQIAEWKTYKNQEYGFELQYPSTWEIEEGEVDGVDSNPRNIRSIYINFEKGASGEGTSFVTSKSASLRIRKESLGEYFKLIPERNERLITKGLTPDAVINGIKIIIDPVSAGVDSAAFLPMLFEHNGMMYSFGMRERMREDEIIEYMIKSFHFVK